MKKTLLALLALALLPTATLFADNFPWDHSRRDGDWNRGRGDYCVSRDKGWEEHWGAHNSCGECLRKHGRCTETCYEREYRVTVSGIVSDRWDRREREEQFYGHGRSDWEAEEDAIRQCRWSRAENCRVQSRDTQDRETSSRACN